MSEDAVAAPRQTASNGRRDLRRAFLLSTAAVFALIGPMLLVGLVIVWTLFRVEGPPGNRELQTDSCQRALRCCQIVEATDTDACHSLAALASESSGAAKSDRTTATTTLALCEMELRRLHTIAEGRGEAVRICVPD
jgi:hypothetical protein